MSTEAPSVETAVEWWLVNNIVGSVWSPVAPLGIAHYPIHSLPRSHQRCFALSNTNKLTRNAQFVCCWPFTFCGSHCHGRRGLGGDPGMGTLRWNLRGVANWRLDDGSFLFPQLLQVHPHLSVAILEMTGRNPRQTSYRCLQIKSQGSNQIICCRDICATQEELQSRYDTQSERLKQNFLFWQKQTEWWTKDKRVAMSDCKVITF